MNAPLLASLALSLLYAARYDVLARARPTNGGGTAHLLLGADAVVLGALFAAAIASSTRARRRGLTGNAHPVLHGATLSLCIVSVVSWCLGGIVPAEWELALGGFCATASCVRRKAIVAMLIVSGVVWLSRPFGSYSPASILAFEWIASETVFQRLATRDDARQTYAIGGVGVCLLLLVIMQQQFIRIESLLARGVAACAAGILLRRALVAFNRDDSSAANESSTSGVTTTELSSSTPLFTPLMFFISREMLFPLPGVSIVHSSSPDVIEDVDGMCAILVIACFAIGLCYLMTLIVDRMSKSEDEDGDDSRDITLLLVLGGISTAARSLLSTSSSPSQSNNMEITGLMILLHLVNLALGYCRGNRRYQRLDDNERPDPESAIPPLSSIETDHLYNSSSPPLRLAIHPLMIATLGFAFLQSPEEATAIAFHELPNDDVRAARCAREALSRGGKWSQTSAVTVSLPISNPQLTPALHSLVRYERAVSPSCLHLRPSGGGDSSSIFDARASLKLENSAESLLVNGRSTRFVFMGDSIARLSFWAMRGLAGLDTRVPSTVEKHAKFHLDSPVAFIWAPTVEEFAAALASRDNITSPLGRAMDKKRREKAAVATPVEIVMVASLGLWDALHGEGSTGYAQGLDEVKRELEIMSSSSTIRAFFLLEVPFLDERALLTPEKRERLSNEVGAAFRTIARRALGPPLRTVFVPLHLTAVPEGDRRQRDGIHFQGDRGDSYVPAVEAVVNWLRWND